MKLGKLGVWAAMDTMTAAEGAAFAKRVEGWGYAALWMPESRGRDVMVHSSWLLANTSKLIVAPVKFSGLMMTLSLPCWVPELLFDKFRRRESFARLVSGRAGSSVMTCGLLMTICPVVRR